MILIKHFTLSTKNQLIILLLLVVGLNVNTVFNEYVLDDCVVLTDNRLVEKGIKGIPEILTTDLFSSVKGTDSGLSEARYRPFTLIVFAFEYQFFGENPMVSHSINILFFAILIALLYKLLQTSVFRKQNEYLAFITCLLFAVHPIHTEVIANVKSRDEIITFLLLIVSLITFIKHIEKKKLWLLATGLFCFFLALLTRESAVTFAVIVPLVLYFFCNQSIKKSILFSIPLMVVFAGYILLRYLIVGLGSNPVNDVANAPFLYATTSQAFATKTFILLKYLGLLLFPHPLSWDYGYNEIPYIDLNSFQFISSFVFFLFLIVYAAYTFKRKSLISFSIFYFMATISIVSNFLVDVGTPLSERFLFQPSLAFCMVVAGFYIQISKRFKLAATAALIVILLLFSVKTILRNAEWNNYETLFFADVLSAPNSLGTTSYASVAYATKAKTETNDKLKIEYLEKAILYGERAIEMYPNYPKLLVSLGCDYISLSNYDKAAESFMHAYELSPYEPGAKQGINIVSTIYYNEGNNSYRNGNVNTAINYYKKSLELNDNNVDGWHNLSKSYSKARDTINAAAAWQNVLRLRKE